MKRLFFHTLVLLLLLIPNLVEAQSTEHYVVVGAFAQEINAKKFTGFVKRNFFQSGYELNQGRNLYYVYVLKSGDKAEAFNLVRSLQQQAEFNDCWVFSKTISIKSEPVTTEPVTTSIVQPEEIKIVETQPEEAKLEEKKNEPDSVLVSESGNHDIATDTTTSESPPTPVESTKRVVKGKLFKFDIKTPDGTALIGKVHHVNPKAGKDIAAYSSEDYADVTMPSNIGRDMTLVCGIFGYKEITLIVDYANPGKLKDVVQDAEGAWIVPIQLERVKSGEYSIMYEVSFFKNSVAMQEKSKVDLDALVGMMQSNPRLKIRIHGHANGSKERAITDLIDTKSYFTPESSSKKRADGSELSTLRAQAVRSYLIDNGIEEDRVQVKGDGSRAMIVPETHPANSLNDRIEIQILKD